MKKFIFVCISENNLRKKGKKRVNENLTQQSRKKTKQNKTKQNKTKQNKTKQKMEIEREYEGKIKKF